MGDALSAPNPDPMDDAPSAPSPDAMGVGGPGTQNPFTHLIHVSAETGAAAQQSGSIQHQKDRPLSLLIRPSGSRPCACIPYGLKDHC